MYRGSREKERETNKKIESMTEKKSNEQKNSNNIKKEGERESEKNDTHTQTDGLTYCGFCETICELDKII